MTVINKSIEVCSYYFPFHLFPIYGSGKMKINVSFLFLGPDSIFTRRKKRSRELEEGFSKKNKDVRICVKTGKVLVFRFLI